MRADELTSVAWSGEGVGRVISEVVVHVGHRKMIGFRVVRASLRVETVIRRRQIRVRAVALRERSTRTNAGTVRAFLGKHVIGSGSERSILLESVLTRHGKRSARSNDGSSRRAVDVVLSAMVAVLLTRRVRSDVVVVNLGPWRFLRVRSIVVFALGLDSHFPRVKVCSRKASRSRNRQ